MQHDLTADPAAAPSPGARPAGPRRHPSVFEPATLALIILLCVFGAIIGMQILVSLGVSANTSLIGALAAMVLARVPLGLFARYRSIHVQNLAQSAISASTFGAANSLLLPIGIPYALGRPDLVLPMFGGIALAMLLDAYMLYRMFDSKIFPASGAWPPGVAAAEAIKAGDQGGRKAVLLGLGVAIGAIGSFFKIPMSAFGIAFIGNIWALAMFGVGLLLRGYSTQIFGGDTFAGIIPGGDLAKAYIPHGVMIGAGLVALLQVVQTILRKDTDSASRTQSDASLRRALGFGTVAYIALAVVIAIAGGVWAELSWGMLVAFILYAAFAAFVHELIVGLAAMHSGWFPAFAVALITLVIGMLVGFPPTALAALVAFSAATGPAFADMGYDLKAGYILRGHGADPEFERDGRQQQLLAAMVAFLVAIVVVFFSWETFFAQDMLPPVDRVYAATIGAGVSPDVARSLALWAIPGALIQFLGGSKRQMGILFATGLLLAAPLAGWAVLAGILIRALWTRWRGEAGRSEMEVVAAGIIAGDALFSFFDSVTRNLFGRR
ncbi:MULTISPECIES: OPT/YSL family transporter [Inquilinus]|uniref:Oligopeptide transporter (OPT) family protein n=1 Tax=Inquilinus ginsengisoli TaxID=363840 RepID=A0ABU1JMA7_9PROT|nr:OPT/YSL family transporter [Inquilinus ginsengisoli]MDR6289741.1 putative oligopeptide transporter (OPT) family protein [Inquilinus ginsengisoli]